MTWDAFQREMLSALGHTLYVAGASPATRDANDRNARSPNVLMRALLRAANVDDDKGAALKSRLPPLHTLAGNANSKRALWPMLRAMRSASKDAGLDPPCTAAE